MSSLGTNHFTRLLIIICLVGLMLMGCGGQIPAGTGISAPVEIKYTVGNPLNLETCTEANGSGFDYQYFKVTGLLDKEVEQAVNDRIKAVYDELRIRDIPPYRGIKAAIPEGWTVRNESITANVIGNFNNILSIVLSKYTTYQNPDSKMDENSKDYYEESRFFSEAETLNFDLNTGKEISLKDLFCDNVDYMEQINDRMSRFLAENYADDEGYYYSGIYGELKLVEPFKGLSEDQKFAVYPYGIMFVFDYRTPQFDTSCMAVCPMLNDSEFGDNIAVTKRFYDEDTNIYASEEPPVKSFPIRFSRNDIVGNENTQDGPVNIYQSWNYSSDLPEEIRNKLNELRKIDRQKVEELKAICSKLPPATAENVGAWCTYEIMVYAEKVGPYINISRNTGIYLPDSGSQKFEYHCYDGDTLKELQLGDIFKEGFDYEPVVKEAIRNSIKISVGTADAQSTVDLTDLQIEEIFKGISGFNLAVDAVVIPVIYPAETGYLYEMPLYIPYKDFGCDNMVIFR